ncbi:MAG: flagellar hook-length control protein FliK [Rhizobiales bacterium]|nr:flagellar hook-length control protein FliK [Hyphomicrobiales bacterium]
MMPLGFAGSIKADDTGIAFRKGNGDSLALKNENKANDFAKALDNEKSVDLVDNASVKSDETKLNDADAQDNLENNLSVLDNAKSTITSNSKQIAFVTIDSALAEKLTPVNVTYANSNESLSVDINGARKVVNETAEKLAKTSALSDNDKKNNQIVSQISNNTNNSTATPETMNDKVSIKSLSQDNKKNQKEIQNSILKSNTSKTNDKSVDTGKAANKSVANDGANANTNAKKSSKVVTTTNQNVNSSKLAEGSDKSQVGRNGIEKIVERSVDKNGKASIANAQMNAGQLKVKSSNNTLNYFAETKVENLGNALQQIVITNEAKFGAKIETVSAPRIVLPESQSVVSQKTIEIQLLPKTLGLIKVKIEISDGKMTLMIEAQTAKAEAAIKQEIVQIIDTIKAAGLSVEEISVRRNAELSQQDEAIKDYSADENMQENLANGTFDDHFDGQKDKKMADDLASQGTDISDNSDLVDTRSGIYL